MKKNKLIIYTAITLGSVLLCLSFVSCPTGAEGIAVKAVYYNEGTADAYFYGGTEHKYERMYILGVYLDTNSLSQGVAEYKIDWTSICTAEDNEIIGGWVASVAWGFPYANFLLRLKNPYDPTTDINKKIYFSSKVFEIRNGYSGIFDVDDFDHVYISTSEMTIDYTYFN